MKPHELSYRSNNILNALRPVYAIKYSHRINVDESHAKFEYLCGYIPREAHAYVLSGKRTVDVTIIFSSDSC